MEEQLETPKPTETCWVKRTRIEKGLICILVISSALITTLIMVLLLYTKASTSTSNTCDSQACAEEALEIIQRINTDINPCENFFEFVCNNKTEKEGSQDIISILTEKVYLQMQNLYKESIGDNDHEIVKIEKTMYNACMNETAISKNSFNIIKDVLKAAGGWPVIEGHKWNETKFDWLQTSYKLRKMGYKHSSILDISIDIDPKDENKFIYKVSIPKINDVRSKWFDTTNAHKFMTDVAIMFGAEEHQAITEMSDTLQFLKDLQWKSDDIVNNNEKYHRATVAQFQKKHDSVDWLQFINKIVEPHGKVSRHDYVLFPNESNMDGWLAVVSRETKRIQANYILWKVVEESLTFLTSQLQECGFKPKLLLGTDDYRQTREEFCIQEISDKFPIDPMEIVYLKKYLSKEKLEDMNEIIDNMKSSLVEIINNVEWVDKKDKDRIVPIIKKLKVIFGEVENHFDDKVLDELVFNLQENETDFLPILSEAKKNYYSLFYGLINESVDKAEIKMSRFNLPIDRLKSYNFEMSITLIQDEVYNDERPKYINYPKLGYQIVFYLFYSFHLDIESWSKKTSQQFDEKVTCLTGGKKKLPKYLASDIALHDLTIKNTYDAYIKWIEENDAEKNLPILEYSPKQLFWITIGNLYCDYWNEISPNEFMDLSEENMYPTMIPKVLNLNENLQKDFLCPVESNVVEKIEEECKIF